MCVSSSCNINPLANIGQTTNGVHTFPTGKATAILQTTVAESTNLHLSDVEQISGTNPSQNSAPVFEEFSQGTGTTGTGSNYKSSGVTKNPIKAQAPPEAANIYEFKH